MEYYNLLPDPLGDRVCKAVPLPPNKPLSDEQLFPSENQPNWKLLKAFLN